MTNTKLLKIMDILENKLNIIDGTSSIKGSHMIYSSITALDKYQEEEIDQIITFIDTFGHLFDSFAIMEMIKESKLWSRGQ